MRFRACFMPHLGVGFAVYCHLAHFCVPAFPDLIAVASGYKVVFLPLVWRSAVLTKDLLRFRTVNNSIKPQFVKVDDPAMLELASALVDLYGRGVGKTRGELAESADQITGTARDLKLSRGLDKIALDRCEFASCAEADYPTLRKAVFAKTFSLLKSRQFESSDALREAVFAGSAPELSFLKDGGLYADLPENERLVSTRKLFPKELLERYNCALAQSPLLYSSRLDAEVSDSDPAKLRRLFKYLKFFRLLAKISLLDDDSKGVEGSEVEARRFALRVDGPASIFESSNKYGLQLASFFPALIQVSEWKIDCEVKMRERVLRLKLDQTSGLVSHYSNFGAYIPEEASMFHKLFKEKVSDWHISGGTPFLRTGGQDLIFPDFSFDGPKGFRAHLELFHKWHATQLPERLAFCERHPDLKLLLGVDRSLLSDSSLKAALDSSEYFAKAGFLFRDFPGVETCRKALESLAASK